MSRRYKNNFLTKVIARIDFLSPIAQLKEELPASIGDAIKNHFPIPEPRKITGHKVKLQFGPQNVPIEQEEEQLTEWHFFDKEREKHLLATQSFMFVEFKKYDSFDNFRKHFLSATDAIFSAIGQLQVKRLGLRYINNIELQGSNKFSWNAYLNRNLLSIFNVPRDKTRISRAFQNLELNCGDYALRFQYGMHNPDYPAPIRKKVFVLDYDAYTSGILTKEEIHNTVMVLHYEIKQLFEESISDKLRGMMDDQQ